MLLKILIITLAFSNFAYAGDNYFFKKDLTQSECEKYINEPCFYRDGERDEKYYHPTRITILNGRVFAMQETPDAKFFFKIKDGKYKFGDVKNGHVTKIKGNIKEPNKCDFAPAIYGFNQAYDPSQLISKTDFFEDGYNFTGLQEFTIFTEKENQAEVYALMPDGFNNFRLCKRKNEDHFLLKYINFDECERNPDVSADCKKFSDCEDYLVVKNCDVVFLKDAMN